MNTAFTRLMWKEYRAQRMLLIVLLLGWLTIHILFIVNGSSVLDIAPVFVMLPICFVVAAGVIAFAGEEDEKTSNFLRMLPTRTSTLMSAKLIAIVSGCFALSFSMLVLSIVLELSVSTAISIFALLADRPITFNFPVFRPQPHADPWQDGEEMYVPAFLALVFAVSVIASMTTRKVFSAVGLSAATIMGIMIVAFMLTSEVRQRQLGVLAPWLAGIAMILVSISTAFLSRPWHLGHLPPRWRMPQFAGNFAIGGIPTFAGLWQGWLQRIVAQPLTMSRTMSMLTWRECRSAVPFAVTWLTIGIIICAGRYVSGDGYLWQIWFLVVFIHECGQQTMRDDQRTGAISLLANIGVQPLQVWICKTFVWFFVMCVVGFVVIAIDATEFAGSKPNSTPVEQFRISTIVDGIRVPPWGRHSESQYTPSTSADQWLQASACFASILGLFSLGQLTACWVRKQIIAFAASLIAVFASAPLFSLVMFGDWPAWITLVPIPFCYLLATATTARNWIDRCVTWRLRLSQLAMLVIPCVVFPVLGNYAWKFQPRWALISLSKETGIAITLVDNLPNTNISPEMAQLLTMAKTPSENWKQLDKPAETKCWYEFAEALERFPLHRNALQEAGYRGDPNTHYRGPSLLSNSSYLEKSPDVIRELLHPFDEFVTKTNAIPLLPLAWTAPWSNTPAITLSFLLLEDARHREADGDISGAVQQIVRAIKVNRSLAMQTSSWANWLACLDAERVALGRLRLLLGNADLSSIDLDSLLAELTSILVMKLRDGNAEIQWQDPRMMLQRRTMFWSDALYHRSFTSQLVSLPPVQQDFEAEEVTVEIQKTLRFLEGSSAVRVCYTMMFSESLLVSKFNSMGIRGKIEFLAQPKAERIQQLRRFIVNSNMADLNADAFAAGSETEGMILSPHIDTIASERATLLTIMLQQYRIAHGKFPESLLDLPDAGPADDFIRTDPWTGAEFFYAAPNHAPALRLLNFADIPAFTAGQPLLFTQGDSRGMLNTYVPQPTQNGSIEMYKLPENVILFLGLSDGIDWRYEQIASKVTVNSDVEIESLTPARN